MAWPYKFFSEKELLDCAKGVSSDVTVYDIYDVYSLELLDKAREYSGVPFILTCGYRSKAYERDHGRTGTSSHCKGQAFDILCTIGNNRQKIIYGLIRAGFTRIGIAQNFIHCDTDFNKPDSIWLY